MEREEKDFWCRVSYCWLQLEGFQRQGSSASSQCVSPRMVNETHRNRLFVYLTAHFNRNYYIESDGWEIMERDERENVEGSVLGLFWRHLLQRIRGGTETLSHPIQTIQNHESLCGYEFSEHMQIWLGYIFVQNVKQQHGGREKKTAVNFREIVTVLE